MDSPGTFAAAPQNAGMLYQWNRRIGWSATNPMVNSNGGTAWDNSMPTGIIWERANDPCPTGWRVPTNVELISLVSAGSVGMIYNGVQGRVFGSAPNQIFLPIEGVRNIAVVLFPQDLVYTGVIHHLIRMPDGVCKFGLPDGTRAVSTATLHSPLDVWKTLPFL